MGVYQEAKGWCPVAGAQESLGWGPGRRGWVPGHHFMGHR